MRGAVVSLRRRQPRLPLRQGTSERAPFGDMSGTIISVLAKIVLSLEGIFRTKNYEKIIIRIVYHVDAYVDVYGACPPR